MGRFESRERLTWVRMNCASEVSLGQTNSSSSVEEEGDTAPMKPTGTGARLWDRVRSTLLRPKVKIRNTEGGWAYIGWH